MLVRVISYMFTYFIYEGSALYFFLLGRVGGGGIKYCMLKRRKLESGCLMYDGTVRCYIDCVEQMNANMNSLFPWRP